jgi:hypothetical protein
VDRVETSVEVSGDLKVIEGGKVKKLKMEVLANLNYDERTLQTADGPKTPLRSARYYDKAGAAIEVDRNRFTPQLRDQQRLIAVQIDGPEVTLFCPRGPMTREELDLVDIQGNSLAIDRLLPEEPVEVGAAWKASEEAVAALLRPDAIGKNGVRCVLKAVENGVATVEWEGPVEAAFAGVSSQIETKGKLHFDTRSGRVTWFALLIKEDRDIGHVSPGLEVISRTQVKITPIAESSHLNDEALANLPLAPDEELKRLVYQSQTGGWTFTSDRRWFITSDEDQRATLRLVDRGDLVAQCTVASLPQVAMEKLRSLEDFQKEVRTGLGKHFERFIEAGQRANEANYREFRVVAEGKASDLPMRWIYYYLADQSGRQVIFAFVVQADLAERLADADRQLLGTVRLIEPKVAAR